MAGKKSNESDKRFTNNPAEIRQEFLIDPSGNVQIPWITPRATPLICAIWSAAGDSNFPVQIIDGNIYCG